MVNFFYHSVFGSVFHVLFSSVSYVFLLYYFSKSTVHFDIIKVSNILLSN